VEELRRRLDDERLARAAWAEEARTAGALGAGSGSGAAGALAGGIEPREQLPPPNVVTITPGMTMTEIERAAIEAALRETRGNRRRAAEMLGIGERTLYRKIREYHFPDDAVTVG
jgi:DNA-binding NtrC family response regulator